MRCMGFGDKWIKACLCSASISALVNGSPTNEFNPWRGVSQSELENMASKCECKAEKALGLEGEITFFDGSLTVVKLGGSGLGKKLNWIKWNQAILPYDYGGLDIASLHAKNLALLGKWAWRFKTETNTHWVKVITSLYGRDGGFFISNCRFRGRNTTWNNIVKTTAEIDGLGVDFSNSFSRDVGDGDTIQFWNDIWIGDSCFKDRSKRLYCLSEIKNITVKDIFNAPDGERIA
ncbi:uncharacterized protein [Rutidosis leptorrhynchoides]|uniref:uncharacterized protein n=1 Tax=Rutidosis leptorrhynchoides TaxID=125765 RepID=UPI003A99D2BC